MVNFSYTIIVTLFVYFYCIFPVLVNRHAVENVQSLSFMLCNSLVNLTFAACAACLKNMTMLYVVAEQISLDDDINENIEIVVDRGCRRLCVCVCQMISAVTLSFSVQYVVRV